ncbi:methionine--tRNA ligase [Dactylosporangium aurantiacum]|uniref:methionine--tRNA ligase n=1 Tax=Dactylosporangium aurantiacum TaxID=35754 RepID=A0A9Q9MFY7_9ACTN|nr:methionine--tRNA ligase [Dactylosporangium aurantiacum]MDG6102582.1 methionine--tRNA ligase [Dactylosporangium aurantiacum]UWZ53155.1 methionine--tRNA ligase [Dactylosporangium aurantiacum]
MSFYVTTAIPYVNAAPHLGHALELVQADVLARHRRLRGQPVRFLTGTDENALKNVTAAAAAGAAVPDFVAANADRFAALRPVLDLSFDDFIRTSQDPRHAAGVEALWRRTAAAGDLYRRDYQGLYCPGCEQFYEPAELAAGRCPEHGTEPETVTESNWFFRLSRYTGRILAALESGEVRVEPAARRNEVLAFVRAGLRDISVSRPAARAGGWGIPVPGDPSQVVYVWWDALANYVTALGDGELYRRWWLDAAERVHVIGKGIVRFHAVYWPALLLSAGRPLPTTIFVHEYLTVDGAKLSKSAGNAVDPADLAGRFGSDALRWWLLRDVAPLGDTDFTEERLLHRYHQDLANGIGNLVNRTIGLVHRCRGGRVPRVAGTHGALAGAVDRALAAFDLRAATGAIWAAVAAGNRQVEAARPWDLAKREAAGDTAAGDDLDAVLGGLVASCREIVRELSPFLPSGAARLAAQLGDGDRVGTAAPVFPRR